MDIIEQARALGVAIQADERYKKFDAATKLIDTDTEIQNKIGEFNLKREELNAEMAKEDKDGDKLAELDAQMRELYAEVMGMPAMAAFNESKEEVDRLLQSVTYIITSAANGEDPMTCPSEPPHCSGSCGSCGGCH